ncbi:MAG: hypothetical protein M1827_005179 [Pycnora praestabilis]|nr:MAG: hypothetical protein M1827_005179 [Pycnora praestabilis]
MSSPITPPQGPDAPEIGIPAITCAYNNELPTNLYTSAVMDAKVISAYTDYTSFKALPWNNGLIAPSNAGGQMYQINTDAYCRLENTMNTLYFLPMEGGSHPPSDGGADMFVFSVNGMKQTAAFWRKRPRLREINSYDALHSLTPSTVSEEIDSIILPFALALAPGDEWLSDEGLEGMQLLLEHGAAVEFADMALIPSLEAYSTGSTS